MRNYATSTAAVAVPNYSVIPGTFTANNPHATHIKQCLGLDIERVIRDATRGHTYGRLDLWLCTDCDVAYVHDLAAGGYLVAEVAL